MKQTAVNRLSCDSNTNFSQNLKKSTKSPMKLGNTGAYDLDNYTDLRISKQIRPKSGGSMFFGEIKNYVGKMKEQKTRGKTQWNSTP